MKRKFKKLLKTTSPEFDVTPFLSKAECEDIRKSVYRLKKYWVPRPWHGLRKVIHSLGASSALDIEGDDDSQYLRQVREIKPPMLSELGWLYDKLAASVSDYIGGEVRYHPRCGLPGFYIMPSHKAFGRRGHGYHIDLQYLNLRHARGKLMTGTAFTFTTAISMPSTGAGMNIVDVHVNEALKLSPEEITAVCYTGKPRRHRYRLGCINYHNGHFLHEIAEMKRMRPGEVRITLQGHGLLGANGVWDLYW